jgi:soluble lytic murein transglycosylase-like protein
MNFNLIFVSFFGFFVGCSHSHASTCFEAAGMRHGVSPLLLSVIAQHESLMNPQALNRNRDGSVDIGLMQINSRWLSILARYGISSEALWEPCTNVDVGAWILASNFRRYGLNWNGLGAYNAGSHQFRARYAKKIIERLKSTEPSILVETCSSTPAMSVIC